MSAAEGLAGEGGGLLGAGGEPHCFSKWFGMCQDPARLPFLAGRGAAGLLS